MTEEEWQNGVEPASMLHYLRDQAMFRTRWQGWVQVRQWRTSERKLRLFACACCRRFSPGVLGRELSEVVSLAERHAGGGVDFSAVERALAIADRTEQAAYRAAEQAAGVASWAARRVFEAVACLARRDLNEVVVAAHLATRVFQRELDSGPNPRMRQESAAQADLLREIVGNPFAPARLDPAWLSANDAAVERIAGAIHDDRAYADLPILADALEEAGCTDRAVLEHCRGAGPHVRGCWVVDLILADGL